MKSARTRKQLTCLQHDTGLCWFDDAPGRDLAEKIGQAARRYRQKYGQMPSLCYVHPSAMVGNNARSVDGVEVRARGTVLLHHFWIGVEERRKPSQGRLL